MVYLSLLHDEKAQITNKFNNVDDAQKHCTKGEKADTRDYVLHNPMCLQLNNLYDLVGLTLLSFLNVLLFPVISLIQFYFVRDEP